MKRLLRYFKGLTAEIIFGPLLKLAEALLDLFIPIIVLNIIENGIAAGDSIYTVRMMLLLMAFGAAGFGLAITAQYFCAKAACVFSARLRKELLYRINMMSAVSAEKNGDSTLFTRLTSDIDQIQNGVNLTLRLLLRAPVIVTGATVLAFTVNSELAVIFCILIPVLALIVSIISHFSSPRHAESRNKLDSIVVTTRESISGIRIIRAFNTESKRQCAFSDDTDNLASVQIEAGNISSLLNPLTFAAVNLALISLVAVGNYISPHNIVAAGQLIALCNYMTQILTELIKFANLGVSITKANVCARRVTDILFETEVQKKSDSISINEISEHLVEFRNVTFSYGGSPALNDICFFVDKSEHIGIIGGTGSGKTTIASLICRVYDADRGEVFFDGKNVLSYEPISLRKKISVVPQKTALFTGTIATNVSLGDDNPENEKINASLRYAQAFSFVSEKNGGILAPVTQNGRNFSGGQRQRIAIARALYRQSELLILDDYNSALDYATDSAIRQKIKNLSWKPAVIVISQRISSVMSCDRVIVLDEGYIVGNGTHEELISSCPVYSEIFRSQTEGADVG